MPVPEAFGAAAFGVFTYNVVPLFHHSPLLNKAFTPPLAFTPVAVGSNKKYSVFVPKPQGWSPSRGA